MEVYNSAQKNVWITPSNLTNIVHIENSFNTSLTDFKKLLKKKSFIQIQNVFFRFVDNAWHYPHRQSKDLE